MLTKLLDWETTNASRRVIWRRVDEMLHLRTRIEPAAAAEEEEAVSKRQMAEMQRQAELRVKQAYEAGFRAGETTAREAAANEVQESVRGLAGSVVEVAGFRAEILRRAESDVVRLSIEIARRILHRELTVNAQALGALIHAALEKLQAREIYRVRIHSVHEPLLKSCLEKAGRGATVEVVCDPSQPVGGAVFEINRGVLDASVETQLREIELGLTDRLQDRL